MLAKPADRERAGHLGGERIVARVEELPAVDVEVDRDAVALQVGLLEIEAQAVGEADRAYAEHRLDRIGDHGTRWAEIGVAPLARGHGFKRVKGNVGPDVPGFAQSLGSAF